MAGDTKPEVTASSLSHDEEVRFAAAARERLMPGEAFPGDGPVQDRYVQWLAAHKITPDGYWENEPDWGRVRTQKI